MPNQQQLFEDYNPLQERLGNGFFDGLPQKAGVYKMYSQTKQLLYVGKAKNMRNRLFTYRRAKMGSTSRKRIRLIRMTHAIDIKICVSEKEALLLENKLIREYQPEFNHAKKQPGTYYFIALEQESDVFKCSLQMHIPNEGQVFGAFKGHRLVRKSLGGLLRILYILDKEVDSVFSLPPILTRKLTPLDYELSLNRTSPVSILYPVIVDYFEGGSNELIQQVLAECKNRSLLESFAGSMILDDLDTMKKFYERCSGRNFKIRQELDLDIAIIPQQKLDDYLIELAFTDN